MRHGRKVATSKTVRGTILSAAVASLGMFAIQARAADIYWDGVTGNWTDVTNWSTVSGATTPDPTLAPASGDNAIFNITGVNAVETIYLNGNQSITGLVFNTTGATTLLGGNSTTPAINTLTLGGNITTGAGAVIIGGNATAGTDVNLALTAPSTWSVGAGGLVVNNVVSGGFSIAKTGTGILTLNGANNYSGGTTISGCTGSSAPRRATIPGASASRTPRTSNGGIRLVKKLPGPMMTASNARIAWATDG